MPRTAAVLAGVAASMFFVSSPAFTQYDAPIIVTAPPSYAQVERVSYRDLNLATRYGEQALYMRVSNAVERVCDYDQLNLYSDIQRGYLTCSNGAWRTARPQMVGAVYRARLAYNHRGY
jgi:UrcA family protein